MEVLAATCTSFDAGGMVRAGRPGYTSTVPHGPSPAPPPPESIAVRHQRQRLEQRLFGTTQHVTVGRYLLGALLIAEKRHAEAADQLAKLQDVVGRDVEGDAGGAMHPLNRSGYWAKFAVAQASLQRCDAAVDNAELAERICRAAVSADSIWLFRLLRVAGEVYEACDDKQAARRRFGEAARIAEVIEVAPDDLAIVEDALARLGR